MPPAACRLCEYAVPFVPADSVEEVIDNEGAATTIEVTEDLLCAGLPLSVTVTVKFEVPVTVGVPETVPFAASVTPAGKVPEVMAQL